MPFDHELKLRRASKHMRMFRLMSATWRRRHPLHFRTQGAVGDEVIVVLATGESPGSDPLGLIAGDCIHNLRASLDLLAYALLEANYRVKGESVPESLARLSEFPIFNDARKYLERRQGLIGGLANGAQEAIDELQPFQTSGANHPLWLLRSLDNINKHRLLNVIYPVVGHLDFEAHEGHNVDFAANRVEWTDEPVGVDTPVARVAGLKPRDPRHKSSVVIRPDYYLVLAEGRRVVDPRSALVLFSSIYSYIRDDVFGCLAKFLE